MPRPPVVDVEPLGCLWLAFGGVLLAMGIALAMATFGGSP
jgi:hypothetical protein